MNRWKKWLTTMVAGFTLCVAPVAAVSAASAAQILLYGAASMALARQQLMKMDDQNQKQMLASTQAKTGVLDNEAYSRRVETIQRNLVATGLVKRNYDVYVNPSKELNAFETVGGVISINRGMVDALNDDELAFTLSHEMQHGEKRHAVNGVLKSIGIATLVDVASAAMPMSSISCSAVWLLTISIMKSLPWTRKNRPMKRVSIFSRIRSIMSVAQPRPCSMSTSSTAICGRKGLNGSSAPITIPDVEPYSKIGRPHEQWSGNHVQVGGNTVYVNAQPS